MSITATVELLSRFLDGDVDETEQSEIEALLSRDAEARRLYEGLAKVRGRLAELPEVAAPAQLGALVQQRLAAETAEATLWGRLDRQLRRWLLDPSFLPAFAVLLALAAMLYFLSSGLARFERDSGPLILSAPQGSEAAVEPERRIVGAREFIRDGAGWRETGLREPAAGAPILSGDRLVDWLAAHPDFAALEPLGVVAVEVESSTVVLDFTSARD